jgi:hypothetical protein
MTAPAILRLVVTFRAKIAKIRRPLGIRAKSVFVFAQPRPIAGIGAEAYYRNTGILVCGVSLQRTILIARKTHGVVFGRRVGTSSLRKGEFFHARRM